MTRQGDAMGRFVRSVVFVGVVIALFATGCGDGGSDEEGTSGSTAGPTPSADIATTLQPRAGGTLVFAQFSEPSGLDPTVPSGTGATGSTEMAAVYDTIMRYDGATGRYEPRTAESVTPNVDSTEWTIKLRPGIKFSDGTDYDAEAVVFSMNRHRSGLSGAPPCAQLYACPRNATATNLYMALVKEMTAVDKLTVKVTLSEPWSAFPYALADEAGMIVSPTAVKKCDPAKDKAQCEFNLKPVGAGPFMVESFKSKEAITMVRNPNYWGGQVYLDGLKFATLSDNGGLKTLDGLKTGTFDVVYLRDPAATAAARDAKLPSFFETNHGGSAILFNLGVPVQCTGGKPEAACAGKPDGPTAADVPTKDPKVRQAIAASIDPKVIDQRSNDGKGLPGLELLQSDFRWYPTTTTTPKYDPELAKKLVAEAKAGGWNGKVRLLSNNSPSGMSFGLAAQAMMQTAGIDVALDITKDTTATVAQVTTQRDYDLAGWGFAITSDDGAAMALAQNFASTSASNRMGFKSSIVDQALKDLRGAKTDDDKKAAFKKIVDEINTQLPVLIWAKIETRVSWSAKVHGIEQNHTVSMLFHKAWIER
jgi:peptide/nickel transport system substrate-binding protein